MILQRCQCQSAGLVSRSRKLTFCPMEARLIAVVVGESCDALDLLVFRTTVRGFRFAISSFFARVGTFVATFSSFGSSIALLAESVIDRPSELCVEGTGGP